MPSEKKQILVPVDFSEICLVALDQAISFAESIGSEVLVLSIVEPNKVSSEDHIRDHANDLRNKLNTLAEDKAKETKIVINTLVQVGKIYKSIVDTADAHNVEFIIMGTNGSDISSLSRRFIGSNALKVVREANCPVITIHGKHHNRGCKKIVLPLDLTKETKQKVTKALEIARWCGSEIHVVEVLNSRDEFTVNRLTAQLNQVQKFVSDAGVPCTAELITGYQIGRNFASTILNYADRVQADLIMIMTQEESSFTDLFISSTAQQIINESLVPVCSIRPEELNDDVSFTPY